MNTDILEKLGLLEWHRRGYDGSKGLSATAEFPVKNALTDGWLSSPIPNVPQGGEHALKTALVFHTFAPGRKLIYLPGSNIKNEYGLTYDKNTVPEVIKNGVDTMFQSLLADTDDMKPATPYLFFVNSAGNGGDKTYNPAARNPFIYGVGSIVMRTMQPATYSSKNPYIDFGMPDTIYIPSSKGTYYPVSGTSFAAPALAGMSACVNDFFIKHTGAPLTREQMFEFLKDHAIDIWTPGKDDRTGYGVPILPHPEDVDIEKYGRGDDLKFKDTRGHWAEKVIDEITDLHIMNGYPNLEFRPDRPMTRAECAQTIKNIIEFVEGMNK